MELQAYGSEGGASLMVWVIDTKLFNPGQVETSEGVDRETSRRPEFREFLRSYLLRHSRGDWGDLPALDKEQNRKALEEGGPLWSQFHDPPSPKVYIMTQADRSKTSIFLASEY